jgi:hypothetical protein
VAIEARVLLKNIRAAANEALGQARRDEVEGAINWGALSCVRTEKFIDDEGVGGYRCFIEGAAPECGELQDYIGAHVFGKMGVSVGVVTEW